MMPYPLFDPAPGWPSAHLGFTMMQNRLAVPAWSYLAERHPPKTIIEIGTHEGGLSCALAILALNYGARFMTFDLSEPNPRWKDWFSRLGIVFHRKDVFSSEARSIIQDAIRDGGVTWVLCDGGCKSKEFEMIMPWLKVGDFIGMHDYHLTPLHWCSSEVTEGTPSPESHALHIRPFAREIFMPAAWLVFRKEQ